MQVQAKINGSVNSKREDGGCVMDNYRILGRIGEGAHGVVYKAKDIKVCAEAMMAYGYMDSVRS